MVQHAPFLEEDLALANVALDYIGRARMFYRLCRPSSKAGHGARNGQMRYLRDLRRSDRNLLIASSARGLRVQAPCGSSSWTPEALGFLGAAGAIRATRGLAAIAAKASRSPATTFGRSRDWMLRLGDGTAESNARVQDASGAALWG